MFLITTLYLPPEEPVKKIVERRVNPAEFELPKEFDVEKDARIYTTLRGGWLQANYIKGQGYVVTHVRKEK